MWQELPDKLKAVFGDAESHSFVAPTPDLSQRKQFFYDVLLDKPIQSPPPVPRLLSGLEQIYILDWCALLHILLLLFVVFCPFHILCVSPRSCVCFHRLLVLVLQPCQCIRYNVCQLLVMRNESYVVLVQGGP